MIYLNTSNLTVSASDYSRHCIEISRGYWSSLLDLLFKNMITILALFCHLAFLHVHCAPKSAHKPKIEDWWLFEAYIKFESTREPTEHYNRKVSFIRHDNHLWLDMLKNGSTNERDREVFACFKLEELRAFLDNDLYAITKNPDRAIRMTLRYGDDAGRLLHLFQPTPFAYVNFWKYIYNIEINNRAGDF